MDYETLQMFKLAGIVASLLCVIMYSLQKHWATAFAWVVVFMGEVSAYGYLAKLIACGS